MAKRLIGTATTNNNGVATLTYTGTGAGEVDLTACYYEEDTQRMIESEIYETIDGTFYDTGIRGTDKSNHWFLNRANVTINSDDTGTTISENNESSYSIAIPNLTSNPTLNGSYVFEAPFCVEYDLISFGEDCGVRLYDKSSVHSSSFSSLFTPNCHVKMEVTGSKVIYTVDGETSEYNYTPIAKCQCGFRVNHQQSVKFKNYVIYPI